MASSPRAPQLSAADVAAMPTLPEELSKRMAGRLAVDDFVRSGMVIGVGSGSTIVYSIQRLAERVWSSEALDVRCVPTSFQTRQVRASRSRRARVFRGSAPSCANAPFTPARATHTAALVGRHPRHGFRRVARARRRN